MDETPPPTGSPSAAGSWAWPGRRSSTTTWARSRACSPRWGRAFDAALLGAGRALLRKQTAVGGGYLSHVPR